MATIPCVVCGREVSGTFERVRLTICCSACVEGELNPYVPSHGYYISKNRSIKLHCKSGDCLESLWCTHVPNSSAANVPPMKAYLYAEVSELNSVPKKTRMRLKASKVGTLREEKASLEQKYEINFKSMDVVLRHFLARDYFTKSNASWMTYDEIEERCKVLSQVKEVINKHPRAYPERAFRFFLEKRDADVNEFLELGNKEMKVFQLEGARILYHLPKKDLDNLDQTILNGVRSEFMKRDAQAFIRGHLIQLLNEETADEIMNHPACQERINRRGEELGVAKKLLEFWAEKDDRGKREKRLTDALRRRDLILPQQCSYCQDYIDGNIDCDVEEIVAIAILRDMRPKFGIPTLTFNMQKKVSELRRRVFEERLDYDEALTAVLALPSDRSDSGDSTDAYLFDLDFCMMPHFSSYRDCYTWQRDDDDDWDDDSYHYASS